MRPLSSDLPRLRKALQETSGNITRAAELLGITKPYMMELVRDLGLRDWARELRRGSGNPVTGRPRLLPLLNART